MLPDQCLVLLNGTQTSISALDLVPGDVILIIAGNKLPADVRFFNVASGAMCDRTILIGRPMDIVSMFASSLTSPSGESKPAPAIVDLTEENYLETHNLGGIPQALSSFLMIIICCLTDCAAAITLAYEKPEADVLLRPSSQYQEGPSRRYEIDLPRILLGRPIGILLIICDVVLVYAKEKQ